MLREILKNNGVKNLEKLLQSSSGLKIMNSKAGANCIFDIIRNDEYDNVRSKVFPVLAKYGVKLNIKDKDNGTLLLYAAEGGYDDIVEILLEKNQKKSLYVDESNNNGRNPLLAAVIACNSQTVKLLLNAGANRYVTNEHNYNCEELALLYDEPSIVKMFIVELKNNSEIENFKNSVLKFRKTLTPQYQQCLDAVELNIRLSSILEEKTVVKNKNKL